MLEITNHSVHSILYTSKDTLLVIVGLRFAIFIESFYLNKLKLNVKRAQERPIIFSLLYLWFMLNEKSKMKNSKIDATCKGLISYVRKSEKSKIKLLPGD